MASKETRMCHKYTINYRSTIVRLPIHPLQDHREGGIILCSVLEPAHDQQVVLVAAAVALVAFAQSSACGYRARRKQGDIAQQASLFQRNHQHHLHLLQCDHYVGHHRSSPQVHDNCRAPVQHCDVPLPTVK